MARKVLMHSSSKLTMYAALPKLLKKPRCLKNNGSLLLSLTIGFLLIKPVVNPAPAQACFYWQSCSQQRGQASNTRAGGKRTGLIRGGNDPSIPYVVSPRNSWISEQAPPAHIHWNLVEGASSYTVKIWQWSYERDRPEQIVWQTTVDTADSGSEVNFPQLDLDLGRYYSVEVITADGVSSDADEGYYQSGFQTLPAADYESVRSRIEQIEQQTNQPIEPTVTVEPTEQSENANRSATEEEVTLAKAGTYFLDEMYADALSMLEVLAAKPTASELVYIALGDTYSTTGLNDLAIDAYQQAIALAAADSDYRSQATALVNLSEVYIQLGEFEKARMRLNEARQLYSQIGALPEVSLLDQKIELFSPLDS